MLLSEVPPRTSEVPPRTSEVPPRPKLVAVLSSNKEVVIVQQLIRNQLLTIETSELLNTTLHIIKEHLGT